MRSPFWIAPAILFCLHLPAADLLWYEQPAAAWTAALPIGNGHLGAMVFGGVAEERIQFNEHTVWTGEPRSYAHPGAHRYLAEIRQLLAAGRQKDAENLALAEFMSVPLRQKAYQPFGDIRIVCAALDHPTAYRRELNLSNGIAKTTFTSGDSTYSREAYASFPHKAIVVRFESSQAPLDCQISLSSPHASAQVTAENNSLLLSGAPADSAIRFAARLEAQAPGASLTPEPGSLRISGARSFALILTAATNFRSFKELGPEAAAPRLKLSEPALRAAHLKDYQALYSRVRLDLGPDPSLPTDRRVERFASQADPALVALLFQYGRYLLIASSRPGGQPANLQGIWNDELKPSWDSKYTVNINTEMNYWPADLTALPETLEPLWRALEDLAASGALTAREHYAAPGWVLHHNFDLWRGTAPINHSNHGIWPTGGAWLALHIWDHYLFSSDRKFLERMYPVLRGAAEFFAHTLVPHGEFLISSPSNSPEQGGLVAGPSMDHQIIRALFAAAEEAAKLLNTDSGPRQQWAAQRARIAPNKIGRWGQLQEWLSDIDDPANRHRHVSHLWALHPGNEITLEQTPDLFAAARVSLDARGDEATGWSMGWKINLWARLRDGERAYRILGNLIRPAGARSAGLYPNLFDAHPPFQIDGNLGATAGVVEMLVQSQDRGTLRLLPALPKAWPNGRLSGVEARGGLSVDLAWNAGALNELRLRPSRPYTVELHCGAAKRIVRLAPGRTYRFGPGLNPR
jgi:alpha-L-fucosidase 2